jgi:hypothetical protein
MFDFSGKVALVTGAAAGMGLATARAFAEGPDHQPAGGDVVSLGSRVPTMHTHLSTACYLPGWMRDFSAVTSRSVCFVPSDS